MTTFGMADKKVNRPHNVCNRIIWIKYGQIFNNLTHFTDGIKWCDYHILRMAFMWRLFGLFLN